MFNTKLKRAICAASSTMLIAAQVATATPAFAGVKNDRTATSYKGTAISTSQLNRSDKYAERFAELYNIVKGDNSKYFSKEGVPYHSIETLMVEAPDQGHESTSEAASYYGWLEAMKGELTGDYSSLSDVWDCIENYYIPTHNDQPGQSQYNPSSPATYAAEYEIPDKYPSKLMFGTSVGSDPLYNELKNTYGTSDIYGMHWLIDVDNFYGYGQRGDGTSTPSYINTYQRGKQESVFETVPQPSWEEMKWGGKNGYLDLFTGDNSYSKQWRYTNAPDADARLIQAMYGAQEYAKAQGQDISKYVKDSSEMGDYLRYSMFDKYFMKIGAQGKTAAQGKDSQHYLLSWYYAWGGGIGANWSWRIGCSHSHFGYQNPMAAYILSNENDFVPKSSTAKSDWSKSLQRQIEMYTWLQSDEGAIAGGCTNSWNGAYESYPAGTSTFYGMAYTPHPVYEDPGSNRWFGMQAWSMQRMCEYYYTTGDEQVKPLVEKWAKWAAEHIQLKADGSFLIPSNLGWTGQPETWSNGQTVANWKGSKGLHCTVDTYGEDVGVAGSLANALTYYAAAVQKYDAANFDTDGQPILEKAQGLLDSVYSNYTDADGVASQGEWDSTARFFEQEVYIPAGWTGKMPNGDEIKSGSTFASIRSNYKNDKDYAALLQAYQNGEYFKTNYHRFWAQVEVAVANGVMSQLFGEAKSGTDTPTPSQPATTEPVVTPSQPATTEPVVTPSQPATTAPVTKSDIKVQCPKGAASTNTIGGTFNVTNSGEAVSLKDVTIRYYFTADGSADINTYVDSVGLSLSEAPYYANLNSATTAKVVKVNSSKADSYLEVTFSSDYKLSANGALSLGVRLAKNDWSNFDQSNDYSYTNGAVVLVNGNVVSGSIPQ